MNGITYYRLKSDYTGDYTKNCALNGTEVDNNFYVLEGRDVKSIAVKDKDIVVTLLNGDNVTATGVLDFAKTQDVQNSIVKVEFNTLNGVLKLTNINGEVQEIEGFATNENTDFSVATDNTLCGDGLRTSPLSVAPSARTGQYKTVKSIINVAEGASLPSKGNILGDRYVTFEDVSDYGYLYDYKAIRQIACELQNTGWRIPTKADWDDLLNAVEPCDCNKDHDKGDLNKFLGRWAGKLLKSKTMWKNCGCCDNVCCGSSCNCNCNCNNDCNCNDNTCIVYDDDTTCADTKECESDCKCEKKCGGEHTGLDAFGFRVMPTGYADDGCNYSYFKERCAFWTATTDQNTTKAYIKRFQYNKDGVYQDIIASNYHLSLRLVKDYNGKNYSDVEEIMDLEYPTLLLPSVSKGKSIWTTCNFACANASLNPMLPNNGQSLTYTRHYFINEWNGFKWVRNEMKQGDTVTVADAPKGKKMVEYRVIGDEFVSQNETVYNDVMEEVSKDLAKLDEKFTEKTELIEKSIETETEERKAEDENLQNSVNALVEKTDKTNEDLATVNNNLVTAVNKINDAINTINGDIATEIQERKDADAIEAKTREESDNALAEESKRINSELQKTNQVLTDFAGETKTAIDILNKNIGEVNDNLVKSVNTINTAISAEVQERKDDDNEIRGTILTSEGTEFDSENGVLTLKSKDGTNDMTVQFNFNFGEF